jgi:NAD-dependent DNA ligase
MIVLANDEYYNSNQTTMTDSEYDIVKEYTEKKFPKNVAIAQIGAPIVKNKVKLPYNMPSMDKIKPDSGALPNWIKKYTGPYIISCKLDGVSGMYSTEGDVPKLYTRGDGSFGQDISHLIDTLKLPNEKGIVVRGEFILPKALFEEKYKTKFANPRNLVSGIINSKTIDEKAKDLHFVTYEVIHPQMKPGEQMAKLASLGHEVVRNRSVDELSNEMLSELLLDWRKNYEYEIDGIIVGNDEIYKRTEDNPDHAFAFKMVMSDQIAEAKVVDVLWNPSKNGYLKPRVRIEPVKLGGVTIEYATGFNGKFIEDNKIGIGAIIQIVRSGDVIPHIKSVTTPAETAKMPDVPYVWTKTHIDIVLENVGEDETVKEKNITAFFTGLEVDGLSGGNVKRIIAAGYDSVPKIIKMTKTDFEKVDGFKDKMINKIHDGIHDKIAKATLLQIMAASNLFGRGIGERKIKPILDAFPNILITEESPEEKVKMLKSIKGIGEENAKSFVPNIPVFLEFLKDCGMEGKLTNTAPTEKTEANVVIDETNPLYGKKIVMTKVRDKEIIEKLAQLGATLEDSVNKTIFAVIVKSKSKEDESNKTKKASDLGIPIYTPEEFKAAFFV